MTLSLAYLSIDMNLGSWCKNHVWNTTPLGITSKVVAMPTISMFYGILIRMFFYDTDRHNIPHIHAE